MFRKSLFGILAVAVVCTAVCSCAGKKNQSQNGGITTPPPAVENIPVTVPDKEEVKKPVEDVDALAGEALEKLAVIPEYPEGYPVLDDVVAQYKKACEAIGWIVGTEEVATDADYTYMTDDINIKYYWVLPDCYLGLKQAGKNADADKLIYNKETFEAYLSTLITADEAHDYVLDIDESFDIPRFVEDENGILYVLPFAYPPAGYADDSTDTFELFDNGDGSYTLSVHYNTLDDDDNVEAEHVYNVKYVNENGRWVFKNFRLVKQH